MSDPTEEENQQSIKDQFGTGHAKARKPRIVEEAEAMRKGEDKNKLKEPYIPKDDLPILFKHDEFDIYINKLTMESYIFHGKKIDYNIQKLEYDATDHSLIIVMNDNTRLDLGARIQWLIRPYFEKLNEIGIVRTKDGESIDGIVVPIVHVGQE